MIGGHIGMRCGARAGIRAGETAQPTVAATLDTLSLSGLVSTASHGTPWNATLTWSTLGVSGNSGRLALAFLDGDPYSIEVRDNQQYSIDTLAWAPSPGTVGVLVQNDSIDPAPISAIEAAINATSTLAQVTRADPGAGKFVDADVMDSVETSGTFSGGL